MYPGLNYFSELQKYKKLIYFYAKLFLKRSKKLDPVHIFFKELETDQDNTFTANVSQENEVENVVFKTDKEYAVTGMVIKPDITDSELVKIENTKELDKISKDIQELIKNYKDADLTLSISNPETKTLLFPFVKKRRIWPTKNKTNLF